MGGVEIATLRLTEATSDQFRHIAFCLRDAVALRESFEKLGIETMTYKPPEPSLRHAVRFYGESKSVARQLRAARVDIVHFAEVTAYPSTLAALLAHVRIACHIRVSRPRLGLRLRLCLLPIHHYIFVSQEAERTFALSLPASKAHVIYDAIEIPAAETSAAIAQTRRELCIPEGSAVVGTVARVNPQKDYFTLASAAVEVLRKHPDTRFLIVGDNALVDWNRKHYEEVHQKLNELGIANNFIFTGHREDVTRLIAAMDLCVLCTHREGFPLSILESMAMRKPIVATAVGGIPEIVIPGVTGYLHQHENSKELADAIIHLIENPEEAKRIGDAGYEHVRQNYSRQKFVDEISRAYWDVMRR